MTTTFISIRRYCEDIMHIERKHVLNREVDNRIVIVGHFDIFFRTQEYKGTTSRGGRPLGFFATFISQIYSYTLIPEISLLY